MMDDPLINQVKDYLSGGAPLLQPQGFIPAPRNPDVNTGHPVLDTPKRNDNGINEKKIRAATQ
jgi:hypothetical protein